MNFFGRAAVHGAAAALITLSMGSAWATEFSEKIERLFSPSVIESSKELGSTGQIVLKVPDRIPDYFEAGDKASKVFAIESVRIFREVPGLDRLTVTIPRQGKAQTLNVTRSQIEQYYGISLSTLKSEPGAWGEKFIQVYDNPESRSLFVEKFVTER